MFTLSQSQLADFLLHVAPVRPVMIQGAPGIGKSALVTGFAAAVGLPCVSLLGTQLAPEDLIGVPQIVDGRSRFCPPELIARTDPYCLFLDELNGSSHDIQKAFYSLINDRRIGAFQLPPGTVVIAAGNRSQDNAIVKTMSSALVNRMILVTLEPSHRDWLVWARQAALNPWVLDYIALRPTHLWSQPPKSEVPFSTPRSWHMLSDALAQFGPDVPIETVSVLAHGCLTPDHATQFVAFVRQVHARFDLNRLLKGDLRWPDRPEDRDILYFLAHSFREHLAKELPADPGDVRPHHRETAHRAKALLKDLATLSLEIAQTVVADTQDGADLPAWLMVEIVRDLPRLAARREGAGP